MVSDHWYMFRVLCTNVSRHNLKSNIWSGYPTHWGIRDTWVEQKFEMPKLSAWQL
jgi:hypothetical protein